MSIAKRGVPSFFLTLFIFLAGCTFDYGEIPETDDSQPDIVMTDVEYVRIRDGDPQVRFKAESVERYESKQTMELRNFSFEQFEGRGDEVNASGTAGSAHIDLESGNIILENGISIAVDSEDITIATNNLSWYDDEHRLTDEGGGVVEITRGDGTTFYGKGFTANTRARTFEFTDGIEGTFVDEDDEEEEEAGVTEDVTEDGELISEELSNSEGLDEAEETSTEAPAELPERLPAEGSVL
jgi:LPS export ABC transporter protein LptC